MAQSIQNSMDGLLACASAALGGSLAPDGSPVLVTLGPPGQYQPNAILAVGTEVRLPNSQPTLGTNRSRERAAEFDCVLSVFVAGGEEAQVTATDSALTMLDTLEAYLRSDAGITLNGGCRVAWIMDSRLVPSVAYQQIDDPNGSQVPIGRIADLTITVQAFIRY